MRRVTGVDSKATAGPLSPAAQADDIHAVILMGVNDSRRIVGFVVDVPAAARDALGDLAIADNEV